MSLLKIQKLLFFVPLVLSLLLGTTTVLTGCSDDDEAWQQSAFGYVQFKVFKSASAPQHGESATRGMDQLEKLGDAKKLKVVLLSGGKTIEQTLKLNAYNAENAEYGLRSDKLELLAGSYELIGFYLYDKLDQQIYAGNPENYRFDVVSQGLQIQPLYADAVSRGLASFKLVKTGLPGTRGNSGSVYPFDRIKMIDLYLKNLFTHEETVIKKVRVKYIENLKDAYSLCDTVVWLKAGSYQVSGYSTYASKNASTALETAVLPSSKTFVIRDNVESKDIEVPIKLDSTAAYLKDYEALKAIWEAMDGPNWKYYGEAAPMGCNWNFNKTPDMWGFQPGVQLTDEGRVASLAISGFGAKGVVPDAIGQLTELCVLNLGAHDELLGGHLFDGVGAHVTEEQRMKIRMDYDRRFLYRDVRAGLSDILIDAMNQSGKFPLIKKDAVQQRDVQFGNLTNQITGISKAIMRCTSLQNFFIANAPIKDTEFFRELDPQSPYYAQFKEEESEWSWSHFKMLTDMEIYNCPGLKSLPMEMLTELPELQMLNAACNKNISGDKLLENWNDFINGKSGEKIQVLYLGYNNLKTIPVTSQLKKMVKLGLLDCTNNQLTKVYPFGKEINLAKLYLDHNQLTELPNENGYFCGYYDMELFSCTHKRLAQLPNVFNAKSKYTIKSIDFSYNEMTETEDGQSHRGVNTGELNLSYNRFKVFPGVLFKSGSPLSILNMQGNGLETIKKGDLTGSKSFLIRSLDFQFNNLKEIPDEDFYPENMPYLYGVEFSYNQFSRFPLAPLNCQGLSVFGIRHQRDSKGNRTLREWPTGLYKCASLSAFFIGSNDLRKIEDEISPFIRIFEIKDNPNITIDLTTVCPYIQNGVYQLIYDKTQNIIGCDILGLE